MSISAARVVVTDYNFPDVERERAAAQELGADFAFFQCKTAEEVAEAVEGARVAVVQFAPMGESALARMAPGAAVIRYGIGYDNIDLAAAARCGIQVGYIPDYCAAEVADHVAALILAALRKLPQLDASVRAGAWAAVGTAQPIKPFSEVAIGFLGLGRIGSGVLERLKAFGFHFLVSDPYLDPARAQELGAKQVSVAALFAQSDVLTLHAPATPETDHIVNARTLSTMSKHAVIVNAARGKLVDETALADALSSGGLGGAALDVFETEPLPADSPLRHAPNVILTPHAAWYSDAAIVRLQELAAQDIARVLRGEGPRCPVPSPRA